MAEKTHGRTASGAPITDDLVAERAEKAEAGYEVDEILRRRGGRPPIGSAGSTPSCETHSSSGHDETTRRRRR